MINPVLKKELKTKMRTWKTPAIISIYIILISGLFSLVFFETLGSNSYRGGFRPDFLRDMYMILITFQMFLILFIVPATTSSSISGERERRTLDLIVGTRLSSFSIVLGKLMSSLAQIILLIVVSIPIISIMFLFGGFSISNIILLFVYYIIIAIFFGSIGVFTSAFFKKTTTSTIMSYIITLFLTGGTLVISALLRVYYYAKVYNVSSVRPTSFYPKIMYLNPLSGLSAILEKQMGTNILEFLTNNNPNASILSPLYINIIVFLSISILLLYITSLKINPMKEFGKRKGK